MGLVDHVLYSRVAMMLDRRSAVSFWVSRFPIKKWTKGSVQQGAAVFIPSARTAVCSSHEKRVENFRVHRELKGILERVPEGLVTNLMLGGTHPCEVARGPVTYKTTPDTGLQWEDKKFRLVA